MAMKEYEINRNTLAIISQDGKISTVLEMDQTYEVSMNPTSIIDYSCKFFGSSYQGRFEGTKSMIGIKYKAPIIIEESLEFIFFPTTSPRLDNCCWISLSAVNHYYNKEGKVNLIFKNNSELLLDISLSSFENQIFRATKLESTIRKRKQQFIL